MLRLEGNVYYVTDNFNSYIRLKEKGLVLWRMCFYLRYWG